MFLDMGVWDKFSRPYCGPGIRGNHSCNVNSSTLLYYFLSHESRANQQLSSCVAQHLFMPG